MTTISTKNAALDFLPLSLQSFITAEARLWRSRQGPVCPPGNIHQDDQYWRDLYLRMEHSTVRQHSWACFRDAVIIVSIQLCTRPPTRQPKSPDESGPPFKFTRDLWSRRRKAARQAIYAVYRSPFQALSNITDASTYAKKREDHLQSPLKNYTRSQREYGYKRPKPTDGNGFIRLVKRLAKVYNRMHIGPRTENWQEWKPYMEPSEPDTRSSAETPSLILITPTGQKQKVFDPNFYRSSSAPMAMSSEP